MRPLWSKSKCLKIRNVINAIFKKTSRLPRRLLSLDLCIMLRPWRARISIWSAVFSPSATLQCASTGPATEDPSGSGIDSGPLMNSIMWPWIYWAFTQWTLASTPARPVTPLAKQSPPAPSKWSVSRLQSHLLKISKESFYFAESSRVVDSEE